MVASGQLASGAELPSIRDLALRHAINPMTVSKVYSLLEAEGLLERNRGKPMTIASASRAQSPLAKRIQQLEPHLEQLVLAARQLELGENEVVKALLSNGRRPMSAPYVVAHRLGKSFQRQARARGRVFRGRARRRDRRARQERRRQDHAARAHARVHAADVWQRATVRLRQLPLAGRGESRASDSCHSRTSSINQLTAADHDRRDRVVLPELGR